jgi:predicted nucleic acid-binding protein
VAVLSAALFVDTSVLVAAIVAPEDASPDRQILERAATDSEFEAKTAWHCLIEFYSVVTRLPEEYCVAPGDAEVMVADFAEILGVDSLPAARRSAFFRRARDQGIVGGNLYDFHIGEIAKSVGAETLVTGNVRHFRFLEPQIAVLTAADWMRTAERRGD